MYHGDLMKVHAFTFVSVYEETVNCYVLLIAIFCLVILEA